MKTILQTLCLTAILIIGISTLTNAQTTSIPDQNFEQALIDLGHDDVIDGQVLTANINTLTSLTIYEKNIADLTGIQDFVALDTLDCGSNQLQSLDVSQNTVLEYLYCYENQLQSLDISQNTALKKFYCTSNQLQSIDVSQNTSLVSFYCYENQLQSLDVSQNIALEYLSCGDNQLQNLNVSQNTALIYLDCGSNQLQSIDVSQNTALIEFYCRNNQLQNLNVSQNTALEYLSCENNQLQSLDVSQNTALEYLACNSNQLQSIDVAQNTALDWLWCQNNQLTSLNVKNGNNSNFNFFGFDATSNPNLTCIEVDDAAWSTANWQNIDPTCSFSEDCALSNEAVEQIAFSIYPNPASHQVMLSIETMATYSLLTLNGQVAKEGKLTKGENKINISELPIGLYFVKITTKKGVLTEKIIKE